MIEIGPSKNADILLGVISVAIPIIIFSIDRYYGIIAAIAGKDVKINWIWLSLVFVFVVLDILFKASFTTSFGSISINIMVFSVVSRVTDIINLINNKSINSFAFNCWLFAFFVCFFTCVLYGIGFRTYYSKVSDELKLLKIGNERVDHRQVYLDKFSKLMPFSVWNFVTRNSKDLFSELAKTDKIDLVLKSKIYITTTLAIATSVVVLLCAAIPYIN